MMNLLQYKTVLVCSCLPVAESPIWNKLAESFIPGIFTFLGIVIAAYLAYRFALKQKRLETFIGLERIKYERKLASLEGCWKLLAYTTDTENEKSVLTWEQLKNKDKTYYLNVTNTQEFITNLANVNYGTGLGIYLSKEVKGQLFEYRSIIYGLLLKEKNNQNDVIEITNLEMVTKMIQIHQNLILLIKNETEMIEKIEMKK